MVYIEFKFYLLVYMIKGSRYIFYLKKSQPNSTVDLNEQYFST